MTSKTEIKRTVFLTKTPDSLYRVYMDIGAMATQWPPEMSFSLRWLPGEYLGKWMASYQLTNRCYRPFSESIISAWLPKSIPFTEKLPLQVDAVFDEGSAYIKRLSYCQTER